jgi:hypothetical protein
MGIRYLDEKPRKITYLDETPKTKQNPNLGDKFNAALARSPLLNDVGAATAGLINKFNPDFPTSEEYKAASKSIADSVEMPKTWGGKIAQGVVTAGPDILASIPVIGAVGRGLQAVSKAPLLARVGGKVLPRVLASSPAQMAAGLGAYKAGEKAVTGNFQEAIPEGLSSAASGALFGVAGQAGANLAGRTALTAIPRFAGKAAIKSIVERGGTAAGQAPPLA